ncbi:GNAT family N-acetyltransferase [Allonocardiopsis opalescens]|uniref:Putative acetyltransferase n=1 Tax=Allonocardiopsis opalescens TaxID=1144618 RepID=A0A2T0Q8C1_9ACTN|nr:GNAT family N-acetyltransferase [Allonocardiopsis opalescens]PRY00022.1 putative acetyltransferase [Allonocardiopsis opalescens]
MALDVRTITESEVDAWCAAWDTGSLNPAGGADAPARRRGLLLDRTWAAFDGDRAVATLRSFPAELTLPGGGTVTAGAVTQVGTAATHRRRGLATRLVEAELAAAARRGEPVSVLIASEWGIYGRFGYGAATEHQHYTVDTRAARLIDRPRGSVEFVDRDTARAAAPGLHARHRAGRPGDLARDGLFWDRLFGIARVPGRPQPAPAFHVLARDAGGHPAGLARYRAELRTEHRVPAGEATAELFLAVSRDGALLLWDHLLNLDLVTTVRVGDRPADEALPWLLTDARAARAAERADFLWVRPLDVPALLAGRRYAAPGRIVLEVDDPLGFAAGRFALHAGGGDGSVGHPASCERTDAPAELALSASALGSVCLGGFGVGALAAAGRIAERIPGAAARADAMFHWPTAPWCSTWF